MSRGSRRPSWPLHPCIWGGGRAPKKPAGPDPEYLKAELRKMYSEYAPEKTAEEVRRYEVDFK